MKRALVCKIKYKRLAGVFRVEYIATGRSFCFKDENDLETLNSEARRLR
jgi:hypothetical protein